MPRAYSINDRVGVRDNSWAPPASHLNFGIHETSTDLSNSTSIMSDEEVYQEILEFAYDLVEKVGMTLCGFLTVPGLKAHPRRLSQAMDLP